MDSHKINELKAYLALIKHIHPIPLREYNLASFNNQTMPYILSLFDQFIDEQLLDIELKLWKLWKLKELKK